MVVVVETRNGKVSLVEGHEQVVVEMHSGKEEEEEMSRHSDLQR